MIELNPSRCTISITWADAPHLTEQAKDEMRRATPPHLLGARETGIPSLGAGAIYPIPVSEIKVAPFEIPPYWPRLYGMDVGWQRCLAKDSMVMLPDGTERPIQDIKVGDEVLAFDFETEELVPTKVVDTFAGFAHNMVTVGISDYQTITCTDDHPFAHRGAAKDPIRFKKIRDINKRIREFQSVVLPSRWTPQKENDVCSPEMARAIGYLLGDGCLTYTNRRIQFSRKDPVFVEDFRRCIKSVGCKILSYEDGRKHHISGEVNGQNAVLDFIRDHGLLGTNASTKFIPPAFFTASREVVSNLLVGLIHTDGSIEGDNARYYTTSKMLADGVKKLCLRLGIYASISIDSRKRQEIHNDGYRVTLRRPTVLPLLDTKQLKPTRPERKLRHDRLLSKYEEADPQEIFCITVEHPDHAFICNGFVVSNTSAIWLAWDRDTDTVYLYSEHYRAHTIPSTHALAIKARGEWIPGVIDPASRGRSQRDGNRIMDEYLSLGLNLTPAKNTVESGIYRCLEMFSQGRLKVFENLSNFFDEFRIYRRDEEGKIVKKNDHLLDSLRYAIFEYQEHSSCRPIERDAPAPSWVPGVREVGY